MWPQEEIGGACGRKGKRKENSLVKNRFLYCLVSLVATAVSAHALAEDAAIEAQEGHIDHWIEFYQKERGKPAEKPSPVPAQRSESPAENPENSEAESAERPPRD